MTSLSKTSTSNVVPLRPVRPSRFRRLARRLVVPILSVLGIYSPVFAGERIILERKSPFNAIIVSEDDAGLRILRFERGGARQSVVKLGDPDHIELGYVRMLPVGLAMVDEPQAVLVVGLGGASLPSFVRKHYPKAVIDGVDIDPEVVAVAKSHFGFREDPRMKAHVEDGRRFIERHKARYDVIVLDAFGSDSIPYALATREFLASVQRALKPRGVVVSNLWGRGSNPLFDSMIRTYRDVFDGLAVIDVEGASNKIVVGSADRSRLEHDELTRRARALTRRLALRNDLGSLVERGLRHDGSYGESGRVLRDADRPK